MKPVAAIALTLATGLGFALLTSGASASTGGGGGGGGGTYEPPKPGEAMTNKQRLYAQLRSLPMLTEDQRLFLMLVAHGESGYNPKAFNDSAGEASAAGRAFERLRDKLAPCGRPKAAYATGSGGRFGRLVPYFVNDLWSVVPCIEPDAIGDGVHDIVSAVNTAHALQGYDSWQGTVASLRAGWATPGWMDAPPPDKVAKWTKHADAMLNGGRDAGEFMRTKLTRFPGDLRPILDALIRGGLGVA